MPNSFSIPEPLPEEGYRTLSPREIAQRARAMACIANKSSAQCQGQVFATLFFDGTGNNQDWKERKPGTTGTQKDLGKHSNVARLYNAAIDKREDGFFAYYIPGVGTPFDKVGDEDGGQALFGSVALGGAAGYMGTDRINWGITRIFNAVYAYLTDGALLFSDEQAKTIVNNMSSAAGALLFENSYRRMVLRTWEEKLAAVVKRSQRMVTSINVAVLGFSRGAAEARAFTNWLSELVKQDDGAYRLAGVPVRIYFMGLFDTVASVGLPVPGIEGHLGWANGTMPIPHTVERCVHYIALHEQRACFPLETAANVRQIVYPGTHSDVGGGYLPTEQGKLAQLSQIPLNDMLHEALRSGVPLRQRDEIEGRADLKNDFHIPPELAAAYQSFWSACGIGAAAGITTAQHFIESHTHQYLQWRGSLCMPGQHLETRAFYHRATQKDKGELLAAHKDLQQQMSELHVRIKLAKEGRLEALYRGMLATLDKGWLGAIHEANRRRPVDDATQNLLKVVDDYARLPAAVRTFMDDYIHDSRAGFRDIPYYELEPSFATGGYLRYREVFWNTRKEAPKTASVNEATDTPTAMA